MKNHLKYLFLLFWLVCFSAEGGVVSALYNSLDPLSVAEAFAFYELYPDTKEGKSALERARRLIKAPANLEMVALASLINRPKKDKEGFSEADLVLIEGLGKSLPNRALKGYQAENEEAVIALPSEEIDLGRALILSQMNGSEDAL